MRAKIEAAGGRRFIMAILACASATALQWAGKLDAAGSAYSMIIIGCVAAYITGGTVEKREELRRSTEQS